MRDAICSPRDFRPPMPPPPPGATLALPDNGLLFLAAASALDDEGIGATDAAVLPLPLKDGRLLEGSLDDGDGAADAEEEPTTPPLVGLLTSPNPPRPGERLRCAAGDARPLNAERRVASDDGW